MNGEHKNLLLESRNEERSKGDDFEAVQKSYIGKNIYILLILINRFILS